MGVGRCLLEVRTKGQGQGQGVGVGRCLLEVRTKGQGQGQGVGVGRCLLEVRTGSPSASLRLLIEPSSLLALSMYPRTPLRFFFSFFSRFFFASPPLCRFFE